MRKLFREVQRTKGVAETRSRSFLRYLMFKFFFRSSDLLPSKRFLSFFTILSHPSPLVSVFWCATTNKRFFHAIYLRVKKKYFRWNFYESSAPPCNKVFISWPNFLKQIHLATECCVAMLINYLRVNIICQHRLFGLGAS